MKAKKDILLCDLDAFFASVEQLDNPELRGKPVLVGGRPESRGVVSTCSYEARVFGVRSAMPMKKAVALCPEAILIRGRMWRYKEISGQVREIMERFTPEIEPVSIDEAYLAVKKGSGFDTGKAIHETVRDELHLPISVGVSTNKLLAKIACELAKPDSVFTLWPDQASEHLWPLPVRSLPGIGPVAEKKLHDRGIKTIGALAAYSKESLARLLGSSAEVLHYNAHGIDNRELECEQEAKSISEETTFHEDLFDCEDIMSVIHEQSAGVGYRLRTSGCAARTVTLKLRFRDFSTITRSKTVPETICGDLDIYRVAAELFKDHCGTPPWRLVGVQVSGFERGIQMSLLKPAPKNDRESNLTIARDKLRNKYGTEVIFQGKRLRKKPES